MNAIEVEHVSKRFRLTNERHLSLKERAVRVGRIGRRRRGTGELLALNDVNLEVEQGQTVGLLGHNGSGVSDAMGRPVPAPSTLRSRR